MFKTRIQSLSIVLAAALISTAAVADETSIKKELESKFNGMKVEKIVPTGYLGLYEVTTDQSILYTDDKVSVIFEGYLTDAKTMENVTIKSLRQRAQETLKKLPLENAVKLVHGDGKRVLITFEDPNCGYCKKLAQNIVQLENVTVYTFIIPILAPDSITKAKQIWCSSDRSKTWVDYMANGKTLMGKTDCENPIETNRELVSKLAIDSVPVLFFPDGTQARGMLTKEQLEARLEGKISEPES